MQKFVFLLFSLSLITRLIIAPIYVEEPTFPFDFAHYIDAGRTLLEGKTLYLDYQHPWGAFNKGPLFAMIIAGWIWIFGEGYVLLKVPAILFDCLTVVLVFYIVRDVINEKVAKYAGILYSFSYVTLLSSAVIGNNDNYYIFFMVLALWLLVKNNPNLKLSAISLGIGSGFGYIPMVMLPLAMFYIRQKEGIKKALTYAGVSAIVSLIIILPFAIKAGVGVFLHKYLYIPDIYGGSLQSLLRYVSGYFIYGPYNVPSDYIPVIRGENWFMDIVSFPLSFLGFGLGAMYVLRYKLLDKKMELVRNIFIFSLIIFVFGKAMASSYFIIMVPFAVMLIVFISGREINISNTMYVGAGLIVISILIRSWVYRWELLPRYSDFQLVEMLTGIMMATIGTFLMMRKIALAKTWSFVIFAVAILEHQHARFLYLLDDIIPMFGDRMMNWGVFYILSIVIFLIAMGLLFVKAHNKNKER